MGLFDGYFDAGNYQGGGGLIDRLLAQLQTQGQYQPSAGLPANPMDANAAAPQNAPIAVGNYQMPRIGGGFAQNVEPGENALPRQTAEEQDAGQLPAQLRQAQAAPAAQPALLQQQNSPGGFGGVMRGALANMQGGPLGMIGGAIAGGMGMGQGTPQAQQQRLLQQRYQALKDAGIPEQQAVLAAIDPEGAGKTIVANTLGPERNKLVKIGQDGLGREQYGVFNPSDGSIKPYNAPGTGSDSGGGLGNMELSGKDYLATIPAAQRGIVQGVVEGTIAPPSSYALGRPYWQNILQAAKNYDPTFDATQWSGRVAGVKDFAAGKSSEMVRAANQTLHHTGALLDSIDALNNGSYPLINKIGNTANEATGGGAPTAFRINAHAVAEEMSKVFKGANLSDSEIKSWENNLSENMSPDQQRAAVGKLKDLLEGSLQALDEKRVVSMGQMAADKAGPIIKPEGQRVLQRIDDWLAKGRQGAAPGAPGTTKTGVSWSVVH